MAYLQLFISELRNLHFKTPSGDVEGKTFIDPVWAKIADWHADDVPRIQRQATRDLVEQCVAGRRDGRSLLAEFDALGEPVAMSTGA